MSIQAEDTFSSRLAHLRRVGRYRLSQVAQDIGISEGYLSKLESGERPTASRELCERLANFYGVSFSWLLTGQDPAPIKMAESVLAQELRASGLDQTCRQISETVAALLRFIATSAPAHHEKAFAEIMRAVQSFREKCESDNGRVVAAAESLEQLRFCHFIFDKPKSVEDSPADMAALWPQHLERIKARLPRGGQSALARGVGISRQAVSQYLSGTVVPSVEIGLRMIKWVDENPEQQKSGPGLARTSPEPETRVRKTSNDEPNSDPPKR